ncbi:MAG: SLC13 family permease, partial [Anaerolineales bacterium]
TSMKHNSVRLLLLVSILISVALALTWLEIPVQAQEVENTLWIAGTLRDQQNQPVEAAQVALIQAEDGEVIYESESQPDGHYTLVVPEGTLESLEIHIERPHFKDTRVRISQDIIETLQSGKPLIIPSIVLDREINLSFWIATIIFIAVLILIATGFLHNTLAALVGASLLYFFSYLGEPLIESAFVFSFQRSLSYIDWNVIFLVMGMMIVIAVVEETGVFQWLAFFAYRISRGKMWLLLPILMLITGLASAFLDNVTTMLLMTPITVQISLSLGVNPLALLMPLIFASNVIGVSTLVGTPTNILIGSYGNISFNDFLQNLTPGVILAFIGLVGYSWFVYRKELGKAQGTSAVLLKKLEESGQITQPEHLKKAGWVGLGMILLFIFGEHFHLLPAVTALMGATVLMVWIRPNIEEMIDAVDWTTLVFFITLFIVVGGIQEVGLISFIADGIGRLVGENLVLAIIAVTGLSAMLSMVIANIPFTAAMLPVIGYLTVTIPGAESKVLFFCLSVGSAMGGNGSLIGASANLVTAGISEGAGYPITYKYFLKKGLPAVLVTVGLATIWLLYRFS